MPPYIYPPSATSILPSFSDLLLDPSNGNHTSELSDATAARSRLREVLKDSNSSGGGGGNGGDRHKTAAAGKDWQGMVRAAEEYVPFVYAVMDCLESDELLVKQEPNFQWQSMINSSSFPGTSSLSSLPTYTSELLFATLIYATSLSNSSSNLLLTSTSSSSSSSSVQVLSSADTKRSIDRLSTAADLLCRASGVFQHVADKILPQWEAGTRGTLGIASSGPSGKWKGKGKMPAECSRDVVKGLSLMALADAQALAVQKLLAPYDPSSTLLPLGPPLPKGHPSPGLLAKLNIHIASLYSSARNSIKVGSVSGGSASSSRSRSADSDAFAPIDGDIDPLLMDYLKKESALAEIRSRKWLGVEAGESSGGDKIGLAIAWLKQAEGMLDDFTRKGDIKGGSGLKSKMKGLKIGVGGLGKEARRERKGRTEKEGDEIEAFLKAYEKLNRSVSFQPIPPASSLLALLPGGRPVLQAKAYNPPLPSFGPGLRERSGGEDGVDGARGGQARSGATGEVAGYAGAGSYF